MTVQATRGALDALFGPRPKLIVAAADHAAAAALCAGGEPLDADLVTFHPAGEGFPARLAVDGRNSEPIAPLVAPPSGMCILLALSGGGCAELRDFATWWGQNGPHAAPPVLDLSATPGAAEQQAALFRALSALALAELRETTGREMQQAGQLAELRQLNEQNRAAVESMQGLIEKLQAVPCQLGTLLPPSGATWGPGSARSTVVCQRIPGRAEGFAGLDLYCPPRQGKGEGQLVVSLYAREADATLACWKVPYAHLGSGWFRCSPPAALAEPLHHLEVHLAFETTRGTAPELALSPAGPWREMIATADGKPLPGALALATWAATPGVRVGGGAGFHAGAAEARPTDYRLTFADFQRFEPTTVSTLEYFFPLLDLGGFRLHPLGPAPAAVRLAKACAAGTERVAAVGQIRNERASFPVEFALCLTDARAGCKTFPEAPESDSRVLGFSGWQPVPPDSLPHAIVLQLNQPLPVVADLHAATRMAAGREIMFHWADWLDIRVRLRLGGLAAA